MVLSAGVHARRCCAISCSWPYSSIPGLTRCPGLTHAHTRSWLHRTGTQAWPTVMLRMELILTLILPPIISLILPPIRSLILPRISCPIPARSHLALPPYPAVCGALLGAHSAIPPYPSYCAPAIPGAVLGVQTPIVITNSSFGACSTLLGVPARTQGVVLAALYLLGCLSLVLSVCARVRTQVLLLRWARVLLVYPCAPCAPCAPCVIFVHPPGLRTPVPLTLLVLLPEGLGGAVSGITSPINIVQTAFRTCTARAAGTAGGAVWAGRQSPLSIHRSSFRKCSAQVLCLRRVGCCMQRAVCGAAA